jgi:predicted esterase
MTGRLLLATLLAAGAVAADEPPTPRAPTGVLVEGLSCLADPSQTYTLYLPSAYPGGRRWPALLIFDPRGRSVHAAERFLPAAERWGWVLLSSNDTRSDGPWEPNLKAIQALWPELEARYAVDPKRVSAAGFSGGGHVAYLLGKATGGLAGVIASGSRLLPEHLEGTSFALFAAAGERDFNYSEMRKVDAFVADRGNPHRFESFAGLHEWLPAGLAAEAVGWLELIAMQRGLRPADEAAVRSLLDHDLAAARALEAAGDGLAALRRHEMIVASYSGLADTAEAAAAAARLRDGRELRRALKEEKRWLAFEEAARQRFAEAYAWLQQGEAAPTPAELGIALGLRSIEKHAEAPGVEGLTGQRLLATRFAETSFYVGPPLLAAGRYRQAAAVLTVAAGVADGRWPAAPTWYNLACAHARAGDRRAALAALERAVADGYRDLEHLRADPDLEPLRGLPELAAITAGLEAAGARTAVNP